MKDVDIAKRIFGPNIGTLKGQMTRKRPPVVRDDNVEIPNEIKEKYGDLVFSMDIMYVNGMPMMTGIDQTIKYRGLILLENETVDQLYNGLDIFSAIQWCQLSH